MLDLVDECGLAYVHAFPFSPREGTPAARMPQLDRSLIKTRAGRLRARAQFALTRHLDAWVGREADALIEREGFARLPDFTSVLISDDLGASGSMRLRFTDHDAVHLIGEPV